MRKHKNYFTTGEFAKIFGIKKQTLFYYDQCGIFQPDFLDENGYRYYSYTQLETFAIITMLRELNVHIQEIKDHMDQRSTENLIRLLESKQEEVDKKIAELAWAKRYITKKIEETKGGINTEIGQIRVEHLDDEYLITTDYCGAEDEKILAEAVGEHFSFCQNLGIYGAYPIGAMIPKASVSEEGLRYEKFYTVVTPEELIETNIQKEKIALDMGGDFLTIYDNHGYTNIHENCIKLINYANEHGMTIGESFYEDVILDDLSTAGYYNYLVKLSIKIITYPNKKTIEDN